MLFLFCSCFLIILVVSFFSSINRGGRRIHANLVYQEYIQDRMHVHMNATMWTTLSGFVQYLGRTGKAIIDQTEKGWFIQYVERDPTMIASKQMLERREAASFDAQQVQDRMIEQQIMVAQQFSSDQPHVCFPVAYLSVFFPFNSLSLLFPLPVSFFRSIQIFSVQSLHPKLLSHSSQPLLRLLQVQEQNRASPFCLWLRLMQSLLVLFLRSPSRPLALGVGW